MILKIRISKISFRRRHQRQQTHALQVPTERKLIVAYTGLSLISNSADCSFPKLPHCDYFSHICHILDLNHSVQNPGSETSCFTLLLHPLNKMVKPRKDPSSTMDKRKTRSSSVRDAEQDVVMKDTVDSTNNTDVCGHGSAASHSYQNEGEADDIGDTCNEEIHSDSGDDDADSSLVRLSEQYRRFSESQREFEHADQEDDDEHHNHNDGDDDDEDLMRSIHRDHQDHEVEGRNSDEEEADDLDLENELLEGAFRSFASRLQRDAATAAAAASNGIEPPSDGSNASQRPFDPNTNHAHTANSLAENMARMFPEAMELLGGFGGSTGLRLQGLIDGLRRRDDSYLVLETLNELSERLLMMNGIMAETTLPANDLAHALVNCLTDPMFMEELELQLVACRCLYNLLEINNEYVYNVVQAGGIEALQSKLLEISYIDLAEQALQTLEIVSQVSGTQVFRRNCLSSCLQYLDFFTIHAQRKSIKIAANSVKYIKEAEFFLVEDVFPILQRVVIEFTDPQELNDAWLAITRIIKNFRASPLLENLINSDLLNRIISVISNPDTQLKTNLRLINTLSVCSRNDKLSIKILENGKIGECIISSLAKYKKANNEDNVSIEALMAAPKDLIIAILNLIINILPSEKNSILTIPFAEKNYSTIQDSYQQFVNDIFQLLINIYSSSVIYDIRRRVMVSLIRIVSSLDNMRCLKNHSQVINLLASIVIQNKSVIRHEKKDAKPYMALLGSLILTNLLAEKDLERFLLEFEREGLIADTSSLLEILRADQATSVLTNIDVENEVENEVENSAQANSDDIQPHDCDDDNANDHDNNNEHNANSDIQDDDDDNSVSEEEEEEDVDDDDDEAIEDDDVGQRQTFNVSDQAIFKYLTMPQIINHLIKLASDIEQKYLSEKASGSSKPEHSRLLDEISAVLKNKEQVSSYNYDNWNQIWKNFQKALGDAETTTISSFELISSGFIEILTSLFSQEATGSQGCVCRTAFMDVFNNDTFELLLKKLQEALTRSESFEITSCGLKTGENKAASLGKQIKVRLVAEDPTEEKFEGMESFMTLIHAISSFNSVNAFFKRRADASDMLRSRQRQLTDNNFALAVREINTDWHIEFLVNDEVIPYDSTIFGALYKNCEEKNPNFDSARFWYEIHEIKFRMAEGTAPNTQSITRLSEFNDINEDNEAVENLKHPITLSILTLLKILHGFNDRSNSFLNFKLTAKLNRQLEEPLIVASGILPSWAINITRKFPFLFPLDTRIFFLQSTSFGYSRLISLWNARANQDQNNSENENQNNNHTPLGRPTRHKVRVSRNHLLQSAYRVLQKLGSHPSLLEIEFNDEAGTGLGPTLEFYANVSKLFCQKKLNIWRQNDEIEDAFVNHKTGLFPCPLKDDDKKIDAKLSTFRYLGKFVARALLDNRIVDFHFNKVFFELAQCIINQEVLSKEVLLQKLRFVDEGLNSLIFMRKNKNTVGELEIDFTLPGYSEIELVENGGNIYVGSSNVEEYISKVVEYSIGSGVKKQIENFIEGFSQVFPYSSMLLFSPDELVKLLGNANEDWSFETLISAIHADHGYTIDSPSVQNLLTLMTKFSKAERRLFLQFLTGSPRLPIGGFKNLKPAFTVVLKHSEGYLKPDDYLPSVMTCANYLKLPNYSGSDILEERLMKAVNEGAGAFLLS